MTNIEPDARGLVLVCPQCGQRNRLIYERLGRIFRCGKCHTELRPPGEPIEMKNEALFDALVDHSALARPGGVLGAMVRTVQPVRGGVDG
jgi:hypothetical protein